MHLPIRVLSSVLLLTGCQLFGAQPTCPFDGQPMVPSMAQLGVITTGSSQWEDVSLKLSQAVLISDEMETPYLLQQEAFPCKSVGYYDRALPLPSTSCKSLRLGITSLTGILREGTATRSVTINVSSPMIIPQSFSLEGNTRTELLLTLNMDALVSSNASQSFHMPDTGITLTATSHPADYSPEGFTCNWLDCNHYLNLAQGRVTQENTADLKIRVQNNEPMLEGLGAIADMGAEPLAQIEQAPPSGFTNLIKAYEGHTYVVRTRDGKYSKVYLAHLAKVEDQYGAWFEYYLQDNGGTVFSR